MKTDTLFSSPIKDEVGFSFDEKVVAVFPDMIQRSVPGYASVIALSGLLAERFAQPNTNLYDLGCSLGATTLSMAEALSQQQRGCNVIAVDNSPAMIARAKEIIRLKNHPVNIQLELSDVQDVRVHNASLVALNYTLQFIALSEREHLLQSIAEGLNKEGVLILSEKIRFDDPKDHALYIDLYHDFKRGNGYSDLEISQKRDSLENVLVPESLTEHKRRLLNVGFSRVEVWFQCFNFASLLAFK